MTKKEKSPMLKITQIKSGIGYREKTKRTLLALGISRMHQTVVLPDNPAIRGMVKAIPHLLKVEEVKE
ncbi:MAG: 50S ribosomal protein L30 [Candidatus Marinimicrobia bacterium]|jgi:large subunit ribosomal protein L30|nr:50S ribosomal protein L30 [Candidatus Neomarinimicrobiota bacterium]MCK9482901.1 50S ribosomal protein L30 [Candidatus Neomarinimicrobiota bacterium]MCK9559453.1 50S ribosomal protein L30 [Candidatus Neomarinimicrobiota bacterium]MDD5061139.1 50S ribosomal protein L30 [Candidatus Neomarinimicrobiota bacterium]MDD5229923.1 50S ribosomal protein L30 [Candidatus Neomarinimicrobiota bacterium]